MSIIVRYQLVYTRIYHKLLLVINERFATLDLPSWVISFLASLLLCFFMLLYFFLPFLWIKMNNKKPLVRSVNIRVNTHRHTHTHTHTHTHRERQADRHTDRQAADAVALLSGRVRLDDVYNRHTLTHTRQLRLSVCPSVCLSVCVSVCVIVVSASHSLNCRTVSKHELTIWRWRIQTFSSATANVVFW